MPAKKNGSGGSGKLTKEEELLLLESSRHVSTATSALFYGNAFIVSVLPLCERDSKLTQCELRTKDTFSTVFQGCTGECKWWIC